MNDQEYENMVKGWWGEEIQEFMNIEKYILILRNKELIDIFDRPIYDKSWQKTLDLLQKKIGVLKNDFRNRFKEDFIPCK